MGSAEQNLSRTYHCYESLSFEFFLSKYRLCRDVYNWCGINSNWNLMQMNYGWSTLSGLESSADPRSGLVFLYRISISERCVFRLRHLEDRSRNLDPASFPNLFWNLTLTIGLFEDNTAKDTEDKATTPPTWHDRARSLSRRKIYKKSQQHLYIKICRIQAWLWAQSGHFAFDSDNERADDGVGVGSCVAPTVTGAVTRWAAAKTPRWLVYGSESEFGRYLQVWAHGD